MTGSLDGFSKHSSDAFTIAFIQFGAVGERAFSVWVFLPHKVVQTCGSAKDFPGSSDFESLNNGFTRLELVLFYFSYPFSAQLCQIQALPH